MRFEGCEAIERRVDMFSEAHAPNAFAERCRFATPPSIDATRGKKNLARASKK
jgi:hypothetical protein